MQRARAVYGLDVGSKIFSRTRFASIATVMPFEDGSPSPELAFTHSLLPASNSAKGRDVFYTPFLARFFTCQCLAYSLLVDFENKSTFSIVDREATVQLCMAITEEFIVMSFFLLAGCVAPVLNYLMKTVDLLRGHQPAL